MNVYVVRLQRARSAGPRFLGIYVAGTIADLEQQIDRFRPRADCEYAEVPRSGMYGPESETRLYEEARGPQLASFDELSQDWHELFYDCASLDWRPFGETPWRAERDRLIALSSGGRAIGRAA